MNKKNWRTVSSKPILDSRWLRVNQEVCELPNGKVINDFYTLWQPDWVLILARDTEGKWIMTRQYRHGIHAESLEFPAGIIDKGETPLEAAVRELQEECAFAGGNWTLLREFPMNPDRHRGRFFVVLAEGVSLQGKTRLDETEDIEVFRFSSEEIENKMRSGEMVHPHQIAAFLLYGRFHGC
jgi:8-oxo-dGTP pyrophosphatase MutT (NUDIX family)